MELNNDVDMTGTVYSSLFSIATKMSTSLDASCRNQIAGDPDRTSILDNFYHREVYYEYHQVGASYQKMKSSTARSQNLKYAKSSWRRT